MIIISLMQFSFDPAAQQSCWAEQSEWSASIISIVIARALKVENRNWIVLIFLHKKT